MSQLNLQKHISRLMALLLCLVLFLPCVPMAQAEGGSCGDNLSWNLSAGTLTISGSGAMWDFSEDTMAPWYSSRNEVLRLELPAGLTRIGELAFYECSNLTSVVIPDSVKSIGQYAFAECLKMQMLNLGNGVKTLEEGAFSNCHSVKALILPGSLESIGLQCFYRLESITSVTIPSSVVHLGTSVFAYCRNLVSADIQASIYVIPDFLFYGCERLSAISLPKTTQKVEDYAFQGCDRLTGVHFDGSQQTQDQIQNAVGGTTLSPEPMPNISISGSTQQNPDGTVTNTDVTVTQGKDVLVDTTIQKTEDDVQTDINVTVNGNGGWDEAKDIIEDQLNTYDKNMGQSNGVNVNVYVKDTEAVDSDFVEQLAQRENVTVTITMQNGSVWKVESNEQTDKKLSGNYNLSYTLTAGTEELTAELGGNASFILKFAESAKVNSEVLVQIGDAWSNQGATLFQRDRKGISRIQATLVDRDGYAHFYLASVDKDTEYCIGMNIPADMPEKAPIIPEEMASGYGNLEFIQPIQYEITGRKSSWNMGLGKVMAILAVVMISAIGVVGAVMYFWNKQRLKSGYVPKWEDEEE